MKKFILSVVALMATFTASAQFSADPAALTIAAGEEKEVVFSLTTEVEVTNYDIWLQCPAGIEIPTRLNEDEETELCVDFEGGRHKSSHSIVSGFNEEKGMYLISVTSNKNANLRDLEGPVLKIKFKATAEASGAIKIQDSFAGTTEGVKYPFENKNIITINGTAASPVELKGAVKNGSLVFTFVNNSGKTIANCDFKLQLPEGISIQQNSKKTKYLFEEGDATEGMTYSIKFANNKYSIVVYDGEFDEEAGNTIISLPLEGTLTGEATVSNIAFGDPAGQNISRDEDGFKISLIDAINSIKAEETKSGAIYNLNGQRVSKATKGIYVVDGKKYAVK